MKGAATPADPGESAPTGRGGLPDAAFAVALASLPGIGPAALRRLLTGRSAARCHAELCAGEAGKGAAGQTPALPWEGAPGAAGRAGRVGPIDSPAGERIRRLAAAARRQDVAAIWDRLAAAGIAAVRPGEPGYPTRLAEDGEAPAVLFRLGTLPPDDLPSVALVGTRSCTHYGEEVAGALGAELAAAGVVVVSGLAAGVDSAAHAGALAATRAPLADSCSPQSTPAPPRSRQATSAPPLGIVGGGVDVVYPPSNRPLWRAIAASGAILSEAPPGARPEAWRFPQRNRLLASASDLLVVVESHRRGGSLLTAEAALRRQLPVGAVPGSVRSPASQGCNDLIADGAHVIRDADDVLALLGLLVPQRRVATSAAPSPIEAPLEPLEAAVLAALEHRPLSLEALLARTGGELLATADVLERLAGRGLARHAGAGWELAGR